MAILKSEIRNNYTTIPNSVIRSQELSDSEYRLLIYLYSLPDGWKINQGYLGQQLNCNRININKKIRQIKEAGYLEIVKSNTKENDTDYIYILKEKGVSPSDVSLDDVSLSDVSENDTHINTNIINKELINKEYNTRTFQKPTIDEIKQYCSERKNNIDAEHFYDYYESNGWYVGKNKMKDWKAAIRTWERNNNFNNKPSASTVNERPWV